MNPNPESPATKLEAGDGMCTYLEDIAVNMRAMGLNPMANFRSIEEFMLFNGRVFDRPSNENLSELKGFPQQCFENAAMIVLCCPDRYIYCEGYVSISGFPLQHAWMTNERGDLFEVTADRPHDKYVGIAITTSFLKVRLNRTKYFGLFTGLPTFDLEIINADPASWEHPVMAKLPKLDTSQFSSRVAAIQKLMEERKITRWPQITNESDSHR
jgi:hypothetical protein